MQPVYGALIVPLILVTAAFAAAQEERPERESGRARSPEGQMARFDTDGDGQLSAEERAAARAALQAERERRARAQQRLRGEAERERGTRGEAERERGPRGGAPTIDRLRRPRVDGPPQPVGQRGPRVDGRLGPPAPARGLGPTAEMLLRRFDRDGDGELDLEELRPLANRLRQMLAAGADGTEGRPQARVFGDGRGPGPAGLAADRGFAGRRESSSGRPARRDVAPARRDPEGRADRQPERRLERDRDREEGRDLDRRPRAASTR